MEVEEPVGPRGVPQAAGRETLPDYAQPAATAAVNKQVDAMAVHNASSSLEIMGQLVLNEWEMLRHNIREFGRKIRQMSAKVATVSVRRLWNQLLSFLRRHGDSIPKQFELDAALILNEMVKPADERPPPRDTLLDIRRVLLEDLDEEGVVLKYPMPAWDSMPPPRRNMDVLSPMREGDTSAYQLFNRPMTVDDDFDRLSLPSTHFAHSESEKIMSLEAQLSLLTRQLNSLMTSGMPQQGGVSSQRSSRPVSRSGSRASLYQQQQMSLNASYGALPSSHNHHQHHQSSNSSHRHTHQPPHSPSHSSDGSSLYANDDSASSYASPSYTMIPMPPPATVLFPPQQQQQTTVAGRRESMIMTGDATSSIPAPPPLPASFSLLPSAMPAGGLQKSASGGSNSSSTLRMVDSPSAATLVQCFGNGDDEELLLDSDDEDDVINQFSPPASPLPPPPPGVIMKAAGVKKELQRVDTQESALSSFSFSSSGGGRSFLDDISKGNFALRKTSREEEKSSSGSQRSSTSGEETEQDENSAGPLVKPTIKQLALRKESLKRISADRSPGGTPQNRGRGRRPSLGQDDGRTLHPSEFLKAALYKKFDTVHMNEDDDDQSVTAGDQSWLDD